MHARSKKDPEEVRNVAVAAYYPLIVDSAGSRGKPTAPPHPSFVPSPSSMLSVENTQPVGSLLPASPKLLGGYTLAQTLSPQNPALPPSFSRSPFPRGIRRKVGRGEERHAGIRRSTPPLLYDQESVQSASQPVRQRASERASQPASQPAIHPCHAMEY